MSFRYLFMSAGSWIGRSLSPPLYFSNISFATGRSGILDRKVHKTETQIRDKVRKANKAANKALHKIEDKLALPIDLTTYVARHSFATVLKRSGVSTSIISESLGHSSEKVTQIYLDSFENEQIDNAMKNLL